MSAKRLRPNLAHVPVKRSYANILYFGSSAQLLETDRNAGWTKAHEMALHGNLEDHEEEYKEMDKPEVDVRDGFGQTPIWIAATSCKYRNYMFLKRHGADLHQKDNQNRSLLHAAANAVNSECLDIFKDLIANGVSLHQKDMAGSTAIDELKYENTIINYETDGYNRNRREILKYLRQEGYTEIFAPERIFQLDF
ncbi:putative ankyrin repeat protein [Acanthamoeba polyphaga mimivirus]|uniref:Ankyrin repeat protein n=1 Tax=Acanthamoeba polyphaga mimivirus Kroon TaxID=3069720 RepID=A0A0G2Y5G7_9VIRU|nr:putative ankyrin repeat protein [Acanthamoeba polyphaga mimivirus]AKI79819.1 putative ankyrin repeat protein [Acanthamoeba polyphaga mimivirus Kroon]